MSPALKFMIGFAATLLMGWLHHGPMGGGEAFLQGIEAQAQAAVAGTELTGIAVRMNRDPMSRTAILSGEANDFQREGQGEFPGLNDRVRQIEGVYDVSWAGEGEPGGLPLLAETLAWLSLAYLAGIILGRLLFGRRRSEHYL